MVERLYGYVHPKTGQKAGLIADDVYGIIQRNKQRLNSAIIMDRDFDYDYFGFKTLERWVGGVKGGGEVVAVVLAVVLVVVEE